MLAWRSWHGTVAAIRAQGLRAPQWLSALAADRRDRLDRRDERNITVNAVSVEAGLPCAPDQVAEVIAYVLSEHGHGLTSHVLRVSDPGLRP